MRSFILILVFAITSSTMSCVTRVAVRPATTLVKVAPKHHKVVIVKGKRYYFWNGRYYKKTKHGYIIVKV